MKVFLAGTSFLPAYGGPARSVSRLADALAACGMEVGLWSPDQSVLATSFLRPDSRVQRLGGSETDALATFGPPDLIHDNGIWLPHNHRLAKLAAARGIPRITSTRGMLEPWAIHHKRWKKRLAWHLYQHRDLQAATVLHATSESEASQLRKLGLRPRIVVIPNGVDLVASTVARAPASKTALFVGRIYPVKGLPLLVEAWARVRPSGWRMRIVGPDEAGHRAEVEALVRKAQLETDFEFNGPLEGNDLQNAYGDAALFILSSHTENFGMVVGEALAHGLPVIATCGTPWQSLETEGCGWWVPVTADGIAAALADATRLPPEELAAMGARGLALVAARFSWDHVAREFEECYRDALTPG